MAIVTFKKKFYPLIFLRKKNDYIGKSYCFAIQNFNSIIKSVFYFSFLVSHYHFITLKKKNIIIHEFKRRTDVFRMIASAHNEAEKTIKIVANRETKMMNKIDFQKLFMI